MDATESNRSQARLQVTSITIGTSQPHDLAHFYAALLGLTVTADEPPVAGDPTRGGWAQIRPPSPEAGPVLNFEYEQQFIRPTWPSVAGGQNATQHLDIAVDDLDVAVQWAVDRGAALAAVQPQEHVRVLFDPDGHPFCLFERTP
ncbi:VOC family protein [Nonomuraea sp. NBC_00507]|uniref:VOC family protein n=1 Tax=Nonomuraea sp. NBC_00507 TaxID=2976002 RepID=UPI002E16B9D2